MSKYTLRISGEPIEGASQLLEASGYQDIRGSDGGIVVTVDAPTLEEAEARIRAELPEHGTFTIARPEPLEDEDD